MKPLFRVLLFISFFLLSSCAAGKQPNIPIVHNSEFQQIVDEEGQRIVAVTKNADKAHLYRFHLARFKRPYIAGVSVGNHTIYISYKFAQVVESGDLASVRITLAHEIAHDVLGHKANLNAVVTAGNVGNLIGSVMSNAPGVIGLAGSGISLISALAAGATAKLYSRSAELEADRLGIDYWKRLGWDCSFWVRRFEQFLEREIEDFSHPAGARLKQSVDLCSSPSERQRVYAKIERIEGERLEEYYREMDETDSGEPDG